MFIYIGNELSDKIGHLSQSDHKLALQLVQKLKSFTCAPLNKKQGLRMLPFIESQELILVVSEILSGYELNCIADSCYADYDVIGYYYCIDLLALYVVRQRQEYEEIKLVLENEVEKENIHNKLVAKHGGKNFNVMLRVFEFYKGNTRLLDSLVEKLQKEAILL